jgi:hypothetical protein
VLKEYLLPALPIRPDRCRVDECDQGSGPQSAGRRTGPDGRPGPRFTSATDRDSAAVFAQRPPVLGSRPTLGVGNAVRPKPSGRPLPGGTLEDGRWFSPRGDRRFQGAGPPQAGLRDLGNSGKTAELDLQYPLLGAKDRRSLPTTVHWIEVQKWPLSRSERRPHRWQPFPRNPFPRSPFPRSPFPRPIKKTCLGSTPD